MQDGLGERATGIYLFATPLLGPIPLFRFPAGPALE
jgi:hypothetical protein